MLVHRNVALTGAKAHPVLEFEGDLKFKFVICVICLLLFVAAVDTIPDPPAINPPSSHSTGLYASHARGSFTLFEKQWIVLAGLLRSMQLNWSSTRLDSDEKPAAVFPRPLVHHAADSSPPSIS